MRLGSRGRMGDLRKGQTHTTLQRPVSPAQRYTVNARVQLLPRRIFLISPPGRHKPSACLS